MANAESLAQKKAEEELDREILGTSKMRDFIQTKSAERVLKFVTPDGAMTGILQYVTIILQYFLHFASFHFFLYLFSPEYTIQRLFRWMLKINIKINDLDDNVKSLKRFLKGPKAQTLQTLIPGIVNCLVKTRCS